MGVSVYVSPLDVHLLDVRLQLTNGYCVDVKTSSTGLHLEVNVNFGWRTCGFSLFEWLTTDNKSKIDSCPMSYYGTNTDGNSLPVWEFDLLDYLNQTQLWASHCLAYSPVATPVEPTGAVCVEGVEGSCNPGPSETVAEWDANSYKLNALDAIYQLKESIILLNYKIHRHLISTPASSST